MRTVRGVALLLMISVGSGMLALSAWRAERLPILLANAPRPEMGVRWLTPDGWAREPITKPASAVLLIHGLDEPGGIWDALAPALLEDGHTVARFDYPNDQPIESSADELLGQLDRLGAMGVRTVRLVGHSMGGLVSRRALAELVPIAGRRPAVPMLITLGTPHTGSPWAGWQPFAEAREQIQRWAQSDSLDPMLLFGWDQDGRGEAGDDLRPGSPFLLALNSQPPPSGTRIVCVVALVAGEISGGLDNLPEPARALGDGVVPADSAAYEHADQVFVVRANHRSMIRPVELDAWIRSAFGASPPPVPPALPIVRDLLAQDTIDQATPADPHQRSPSQTSP